jgi:hypothetical protein
VANRSVSIELENDESVTCTFVGSLPIWKTGDVISYSDLSWGEPPSETNAAGLLVANFNAVYPDGLFVGIYPTGYWIGFTNSAALLLYLPASGFPFALRTNYVNPTTTVSGLFGGGVVGLKLDIDFADAGITLGSSKIPFGDLALCGFTDLPALNGLSVRQYLAAVNMALGGGSAIYAIDPYLDVVTFELNRAFEAGSPNQFAQDHVVYGACP